MTTEPTVAYLPKAIWITGRKYYQTELCLVGDGECDATLVPEPENEYDPNAIRVDCAGHKVGYIPATKAAELAPHMDGHLAVRILVHAPDDQRAQWGAQLVGVYR